jgi:hypothetical protein
MVVCGPQVAQVAASVAMGTAHSEKSTSEPDQHTEPLTTLEPDILRLVVGGGNGVLDGLFHAVDVATSGIGWGITNVAKSPAVRVLGGVAGVVMFAYSLFEECKDPHAHTAPTELDGYWTGHGPAVGQGVNSGGPHPRLK